MTSAEVSLCAVRASVVRNPFPLEPFGARPGATTKKTATSALSPTVYLG